MVLFLVLGPFVANPCGGRPLLPAYSHNDYLEVRPLAAALEAGMRGVEADLIYEDGRLLVGHDRGHLSRERTLDALYLAPLRERVGRCGRVLDAEGPFRLNLELKGEDPAAFRALLTELSRYGELFEASTVGGTPPVAPVLVGWWPPGAVGDANWPSYLRVHLRVEARRAPGAADLPVGMVSVDARRELRWTGGRPTAVAVAVLRRARQIADARGVPLRVYHVPPAPAVYAWLRREKVDLIAVRGVSHSRRLFREAAHAVHRTRL